jgi:hypothetical protein
MSTSATNPIQIVRRRLPRLMGVEAATLAVMSFLHLSGILAGGSKPFDRTDAGVAEALICLALTCGAVALLRKTPRARGVAVATIGFAILGFLAGLNFTIQGGDRIGIAYHATLLPLLIFSLVLPLRTSTWASAAAQPSNS